MEQQSLKKKMRIALTGTTKSPKLFNALQIAFGLCGAWNRIIVIGASRSESQYQYLGPYNSLHIAADSTPQRYMETLNLAGNCGKEVVIFSSFSNEWREGVTRHLDSSYCEELFRAHGSLMRVLRHSPVHIICCVDTERKFNYGADDPKRSFKFAQEPIQQKGFERNFTAVLQIDRKGNGSTLKDVTGMMPGGPYPVTPLIGTYLFDWCKETVDMVPDELKKQIDLCQTVDDLNRLMWAEAIEEEHLLAAFTKRRLELESETDTGSSYTNVQENQHGIVQ